MAELLGFDTAAYGGEVTVNNDLFAQFSQHVLSEVDNVDDTEYNYCPDCQIPMVIAIIEYSCKSCGYTTINDLGGYKDHGETVNGSLRITTGTNKGRFYNTTCDYTKTQRKMIITQLCKQQTKYTGPAFPMNVLNATATQYNQIQKMITEDDFDENGIVMGQKKFVRRGTIKDEILAALLYFECAREKIMRKKKDVAMFMGLDTNGFSRGENILRNLEAEGKIDIPINDIPVEGFVERYLEALGMENPMYEQFIIELVEESERKRICMNSQISSKIVGAIWILIDKKNLKISAKQLEKATDNTKKNTFIKFYNIVLGNMRTFTHIFAKYGIM